MTTENIHKHRILILDFGSQYTQLVARRVRELGVYCELGHGTSPKSRFASSTQAASSFPVARKAPPN